MGAALYAAAALIVGGGLVHSVLGERHLLSWLARRADLPPLLGGPEITLRIFRFAWHFTSLAWFGFAALLVLMAQEALSPRSVAAVLSAVFLTMAVVTALASRGRHLAWPLFLVVGLVTLAGALI